MRDRRKLTDRRSFDTKEEQTYPRNRRRFPDRRLNSISAEWVPLEHVYNHPATETLFTRLLSRIVKRW